MGPLLTIPRVLHDRGFDPAEVLTECGLARDVFDDAENTIPIGLGSRLLALCAARTGIPHFALLVAQGAPAGSLGTVAYLVLSSPTVGAALAHLVAYLNLQDRGGIATLRSEGARAVLTYALVDPHVEGTDHAHTLAMAVGQNILRGLCGPQWRPTVVSLPCPRPRNVAPYRAFFGVTPLFDAQEAALIFPARELETPLAGADASLNRLMRDRADSVTRIAENDLAHEVRRQVSAHPPVARASLARVAASIGLNERTISRKLAQQGASFRDIRDAVCYDAARDLLTDSDAAITEVAHTLGYADSAAFTRAFARWSGTTPAQWRRDRGLERP